jgi:hypothetical protein
MKILTHYFGSVFFLRLEKKIRARFVLFVGLISNSWFDFSTSRLWIDCFHQQSFHSLYKEGLVFNEVNTIKFYFVFITS